jgi:hypothetical protein
MISLVGMGEFCCSIVDRLQYPQYVPYKVLPGIAGIPVLKNAEQYEGTDIDFNNFIIDNNKSTTVFVDGSEAISGLILKLLEPIKDREINIVYVRSDLQLASNTEKLQHKVCYNILQEYARSGLFKKIIFVDKLKLEQIIGNFSILDYEEKLTHLIASTYHMINVYANTKPVLTNTLETNDVCRIETIGISGIQENNIKWFFELENINEITYYYAINSAILKKEQKLLQTIKKQVKDKQETNLKVMFGIYETQYDETYVYCSGKTKFIQP